MSNFVKREFVVTIEADESIDDYTLVEMIEESLGNLGDGDPRYGEIVVE